MKGLDSYILKALLSDAQELTEIAFQAKKHWPYPEEYFETWKSELTITKNYIRNNIVYKFVYKDFISGFYSIVINEKDFHVKEVLIQKGIWLEHLFILPAFHKKGFGKELIQHAKNTANELGFLELLVFVDPYAQGFYDKIGAQFINLSKSSIPGRFIPIYSLHTK
jgi:maltose O-acetyltransferase